MKDCNCYSDLGENLLFLCWVDKLIKRVGIKEFSKDYREMKLTFSCIFDNENNATKVINPCLVFGADEEVLKMAKLKTAARNKLKKSTFGIPSERKYPMPDKAHAVNAKARATQMVKKGKLSPSTASKIKAKANKVLGKKK